MEGFNSIFIDGEYRKLRTVNSSLLVLTTVFLVTLLALGHILGGVKEMDRRMNDPFSNWLNIPVTVDNEENRMQEFHDYFSENGRMDSFGINQINPYQIDWLKIYNKEINRSIKLRARSVDINDPLNKLILSDENIIYHNSLDSEEIEYGKCNIVITNSALQLLGFDSPITEVLDLFVLNNYHRDLALAFDFKISHVVDELPGDADIVIDDQLMTLLNTSNEETGFTNTDSSNKLRLITGNENTIGFVESYLEDENLYKNKYVEKISVNGEEFTSAIFILNSHQSIYEIREIQKWVATKFKRIIIPDSYECQQIETQIEPYYYSVHFGNLEKVKYFREYLRNKFGVKVNMADVESKQNFYLVSRIAVAFIGFLALFSVFSIVIFTRQLVINHFEKTSSNIGTLMAFGLGSTTVKSIYTRVIMKLFFTATMYAFLILMCYKLLLVLLGIGFLFELFSFQIFLFLLVLSVSVFYFINVTINTFSNVSPGNLIYKRT